MHDYQDLIRLFDACFASHYNTRLLRGGDEPVYLPADQKRPYHALYFAHGFYSSALHECAHWFLAGEARRQLVDYGYWYSPDGRSPEEQVLFQKVEVKPQALEWILSEAAGYPFRVSLDNLNGEASSSLPFQKAVLDQVISYCHQGLPQRAEQFRSTLCAFYKRPACLEPNQFNLRHYSLPI